jgi:hypothetical protein
VRRQPSGAAGGVGSHAKAKGSTSTAFGITVMRRRHAARGDVARSPFADGRHLVGLTQGEALERARHAR